MTVLFSQLRDAHPSVEHPVPTSFFSDSSENVWRDVLAVIIDNGRSAQLSHFDCLIFKSMTIHILV
jgi:hypothetical protein